LEPAGGLAAAQGLSPPPPDTIPLSQMSKSFAAPPSIRRIAARRVFKAPGGKPVVITLGVPQAVPGSDPRWTPKTDN